MQKKRIFLILVSVLLIGLFAGITIGFPEIQNYKIRREVFAYVKENMDSMEIRNADHFQYFTYTEWGFGDAGVIYGYIYDPNTDYKTVGRKYRGGIRIDGPTTYGDGWFYYKEICNNWYYYEEHYG